MRPILLDMNDMSDSSEVYESRPHPFFIIFIYLLLVIVVVSILWAAFFKIDIVVKGTGTVSAREDSSIVTNTYAGAVTKCNIVDADNRISQAQKEINDAKTRIAQAQTTRISMEEVALKTAMAENRMVRYKYLVENETQEPKAEEPEQSESSKTSEENTAQEEDSFLVKSFINNQDIAKIQPDMEVKYEVAAYPSSEYGTMTGNVEFVSADLKANSEDGSAYYVVETSIDDAQLYNKTGEKLDLKVGMYCDTKIIVEQKSVLRFLLEKIHLLD